MTGSEDPLDHARTTRPHAGEAVKDTKNLPALAIVGVALILFVFALTAFATDNPATGTMTGLLAVAGFVVGLVWLALTHQRVRRIEDRWHEEHPEALRQPPNS